jgi:hypothetical protein
VKFADVVVPAAGGLRIVFEAYDDTNWWFNGFQLVRTA